MKIYVQTDILGTFIRDDRFSAELYENNLDLDALTSGTAYENCLVKPCQFASWGGQKRNLSLIDAWTNLRDHPPLWSCILRVVCGEFMNQKLNDILTRNVTALCPRQSARLYLRCTTLTPKEDSILIEAASEVPDFDLQSITRDKDA